MLSPLYTLKQASLEDLPSLSLLERLSQSPDNWTPRDFSLLLTPPLDPTYHLFLLLFNNSPLSYICCHYVPPSSLDLLSLVTHPHHQRQGFGTLLFLSYLSLLPAPIPKIACTVRESNLPAQLFLKSLSFRCTAITPPLNYPPEPFYLFENNGPPIPRS